MKRVLNIRETYEIENNLLISENYYPVSQMIAIFD
jgi:hypothetical protein